MNTLKQSFIRGTLILLAAGIVNRILGFIPRIVLPRIIGAEGIGLYQMGLPFLYLLLTVITGGIPLAVAKMTAEAETSGNEQRVRRVFAVSLVLTFGVSTVFAAFAFLAAGWLTDRLFTDPRVYMPFLWMSPIVMIVGVSAVYRGYFQGRQNMIPSAASSVVETIVRIAAVLLLASWLLPRGVEYAAAGAVAGFLAGEIAGLLVLLIQFQQSKGRYSTYDKAKIGTRPSAGGRRAVLRKLLRISIPVTASRLVGSSSYFLESILIVQSLAIAGVATAAATAQYGALQGMIFPILVLPGVLTSSLSVSLVPSLSEAAARGDMRTVHNRLHQSLRLALVTGAPFAAIMYVLADPLCYFLYDESEIGVMLKMMAPIALFIYFQGPLQAALQALDRPGSALVNSFVGSVVKLTLIYALATKPGYGILGAIMAINVNIVVVTLLHWNSLSRLLKFKLDVSEFLKVGVSMLAMGAALYGVMSADWSDSALLRFFAAVGTGLLVYLACITRLNLIDRHDLRRVPWIGKRK